MPNLVYRSAKALSELPGGKPIVLIARGLSHRRRRFVGTVSHTPEHAHTETLAQWFLADGTEVTSTVQNKSLSSDEYAALVAQGLRGTQITTGRIVVSKPASSIFHGDALGAAEILAYAEVEALQAELTLRNLDTLPSDGQDFLLKRTTPYPFPIWSLARMERGHIRFSQGGGVYPGNPGQMAHFEGWVEIPPYS